MKYNGARCVSIFCNIQSETKVGAWSSDLQLLHILQQLHHSQADLQLQQLMVAVLGSHQQQEQLSTDSQQLKQLRWQQCILQCNSCSLVEAD